MANRGRHEFTVGEAVNMDSFVSWHYEELDLNDPNITFSRDGTLVSGANTITQITHVAGTTITVGMHVTGTNIPANTSLLSATLNTETNKWACTMSANATGNITTSVTFNGGVDIETASYITAVNPAKKIIIYDKPGPSGGVMDETDILSLAISSAADTFQLTIDASDLPFTISGFMVEGLTVENDVPSKVLGLGNNAVSILSFH